MTPEEISVQVEQKEHRGAFFIERTDVSESLRGQGIARKLVEAAVAWARRTNVKLVPLCPFAKAVFDREPEFGDVRA